MQCAAITLIAELRTTRATLTTGGRWRRRWRRWWWSVGGERRTAGGGRRAVGGGRRAASDGRRTARGRLIHLLVMSVAAESVICAWCMTKACCGSLTAMGRLCLWCGLGDTDISSEKREQLSTSRRCLGLTRRVILAYSPVIYVGCDRSWLASSGSKVWDPFSHWFPAVVYIGSNFIVFDHLIQLYPYRSSIWHTFYHHLTEDIITRCLLYALTKPNLRNSVVITGVKLSDN